jgi:hypothetical protein
MEQILILLEIARDIEIIGRWLLKNLSTKAIAAGIVAARDVIAVFAAALTTSHPSWDEDPNVKILMDRADLSSETFMNMFEEEAPNVRK